MRRLAIAAAAVAVGLGTAASPFASGAPDGLDRVAADRGFAASERPSRVQERAPAAGYAVPGVGGERLATGLAGLAGTLGLLGLGAGGGILLRRRAARRAPAAAPGSAA